MELHVSEASHRILMKLAEIALGAAAVTAPGNILATPNPKEVLIDMPKTLWRAGPEGRWPCEASITLEDEGLDGGDALLDGTADGDGAGGRGAGRSLGYGGGDGVVAIL